MTETMTLTLPVLSVIVPVYNEERQLARVIEALLASKCPIGREWIFVDDCSTDQSLAVLRERQARHGYRIIEQMPNQGKGSAVIRGIREAKGDLIMVQDADFEYDPCDVPALLQPLLDGQADVVYGSRFKKSSWQREKSDRCCSVHSSHLSAWPRAKQSLARRVRGSGRARGIQEIGRACPSAQRLLQLGDVVLPERGLGERREAGRSGWRAGGEQAEVGEDSLDDRPLVDEGDDLAASAAGAGENVFAEDAKEQLAPRNTRIEGRGGLLSCGRLAVSSVTPGAETAGGQVFCEGAGTISLRHFDAGPKRRGSARGEPAAAGPVWRDGGATRAARE
jgi:Glycosyl transferase family 2